MGEKLIVGPIDSGKRTNRLAFNIDNDSFPLLQNAYQWRGRVKRKRGTQLIGRLQLTYQGYIKDTDTNINGFILSDTTDGTANYTVVDVLADPNVNLRSLYPNAEIMPSSVTIVRETSSVFYTDDGNGNLNAPNRGTGTINYSTGELNITFTAGHIPSAGKTLTILFNLAPNLPVMGIDDFFMSANSFPGCVAFDPVNSYQISTVFPYTITNTNWFENPPSIGTYVQKTAWTPFNWNGADYRQFWTTNHQGALWATNGTETPFTGASIGMQFSLITNIVVTTPTTVNITTANNLVVGDFVFINEVTGIVGINWQTGYLTAASPTVITVVFPSATISGAYISGGIVQYLTNVSNPTEDCIRYYTGSPTNGAADLTFNFVTGTGWVNFMPPLSQSPFSIGDLPPAIYYLVGARLILPFKDRLQFFGPVVQSSTSAAIYLQDTVVYSQNGTPYYTASYTNRPSSTVDTPTTATNVYTPAYIVPANQTAAPNAYFADSIGFGGNVSAGLDQPIVTVSPNEDVLILGFNPTYQVRYVYTGNDVIPFNFFIVNSELGSASTFSSITMDKSVITRGPRGYVSSSQVEVARIDLDIPDEVFEISLSNNGNERFTAHRDFINEWIYFTYPGDMDDPALSPYPNTTLLYNYRDNTWANFFESYTTYGPFRPSTGQTWATIPFKKWNAWDEPWNSGSSNLFQPLVLGGNQQGFVLARTNETSEDTSLWIQAISGSTVTSPNHCLNNGDYILITGASGTIGANVNGNVYSVLLVDKDSFKLNPSLPKGSFTYLGNGLITRYYVPFIQTKQFPAAWALGKKTRIGVQQYLLSTTANSQITVYIYLSQDDATPWNAGPILPSQNVLNNSLVYSQVVYTCPESTNLGLTAYTTNLQQLTQVGSNTSSSNVQQQIWHRVNTSLIGDTIQLGFTMSDAQMRDTLLLNQVAEIELHGFILDITPSQTLS